MNDDEAIAFALDVLMAGGSVGVSGPRAAGVVRTLNGLARFNRLPGRAVHAQPSVAASYSLTVRPLTP